MQKLANDLGSFIEKYGPSLKIAAESVLIPRFNPEKDVWPDMNGIEKHRSKAQGKPFKYFPAQIVKLAGAVSVAREFSGSWMVCSPGSGKTAMSIGALSELLKNRKKNWRVIVMCPGHLVNKWKREIDWMVPNVETVVLKDFNDLQEFHRRGKNVKHPMFAVVGKDRAKLGFDVDRPCAAKARRWILQDFDYHDEIPKTAKSIKRCVKPDGLNFYQAMVNMEVVTCPLCGSAQFEKDDADGKNPLLYEEYLKKNRIVRCTTCHEKLSTNARGFRKNPHMDRYIQRKMKGFFDVMIADEVHELAGSDTIQGNCFGTIASACEFVFALTGTLIGGNAKDLHALLWRMAPDLMRKRGFDITKLKDGKISAIARGEKAFVGKYGVMETQLVYSRGSGDDYAGKVNRGACGRKKSYKTTERPRPGISPDLYNHFLLERAVFMDLEELGPELPTLDRVLIGCKPSEDLKRNYRMLDNELEAAIQERVTGNGPPVLAGIRIQALDSYLDTPFGWDGIYAPLYTEDGERNGSVKVATPENMDFGHLDDKDARLLETVKSELKQGRRCAIYVSYVGKHNVRPKIMKMLADAKIRVMSMPDSLDPIDREDWVIANVDKMDVLVVQPKRVMTGLDLVQFPSLIWYQLGFSTHVLRQASARARRPIQTLPCKVFFLYYEGTIQEQSLAFMGEKEAASQALEGTFDTRALKALMNGGENDDIMSALANNLAGKDAKKAWAAINRPFVPAPATAPRQRFKLFPTVEVQNPTKAKVIISPPTSKVPCLKTMFNLNRRPVSAGV